MRPAEEGISKVVKCGHIPPWRESTSFRYAKNSPGSSFELKRRGGEYDRFVMRGNAREITRAFVGLSRCSPHLKQSVRTNGNFSRQCSTNVASKAVLVGGEMNDTLSSKGASRAIRNDVVALGVYMSWRSCGSLIGISDDHRYAFSSISSLERRCMEDRAVTKLAPGRVSVILKRDLTLSDVKLDVGGWQEANDTLFKSKWFKAEAPPWNILSGVVKVGPIAIPML